MLNGQYLTIGSIFFKFFEYRACADSGSTGHKNVPNIVSLSHCFEQLYSCIFNSYVKAYLNIWWRRMYGLKLFWFTSCRRVYRCVRDDWQLCFVRVNSLITHLQLKKFGNIPVCACCNHFPITWNEFYHITEPNNFEYSHKVLYIFYGKISAILLIFILKKSNLEVPCKRNRFGYWNSCKRLPNFVNVAALQSKAFFNIVFGLFSKVIHIYME